MGRALTIFFGLLAFGLLVYICLGHQGEIQREIADNARVALVTRGHEFAQVSAAGQTIVLRGTAESPAQRLAAEQTVLAVPGVEAVDNQIVLLADVPPPGPDSSPMVSQASSASSGSSGSSDKEATVGEIFEASNEPPTNPSPVPTPEPIVESLLIELSGAEQTLRVDGLALEDGLAEPGTTVRREALREMVGAALPGWTISGDLEPGANLATEFEVSVQEILPALAGANRAQLEIDATQISIDADYDTFADRSALEGVLTSLKTSEFAGSRELSWSIDSPEPVPEPDPKLDGCQQAFDELLAADSIKFTTNLADIRPASLGLLNKLVDVARDCKATIEIEGHTDSRGSVETNLELSQARADRVRSYLIDNGVDGARISARGLGSQRPIADNNTVNGRQANRRIEFRVQRPE